MEDRNENVILNISHMHNRSNVEIRSNDITYSNKKGNSFSKENKIKKENELFKKNSNYSYIKNKNRKKTNESIYPVKIKKMAKDDIIIREDDTKKYNIIKQNSTTDFSDIDNKKLNDIIYSKRFYQKLKGKKLVKINNKYICNICQKEYNIKNSFSKHLLTHKTKQFTCPKCNAKFSINSKLKRHLLIHSDQKEFKCSLCEAEFNLKYNLKVHMRIHNNEKPYICGYPGCFAKFAQQNNLRTHNKIHINSLIKEDEEIKMLLNYHNSVIKFNSKDLMLNNKLLELNKIAMNC